MKITYYGTASAEGYPSAFCTCKNCTEARARGGKNLRTRSQAMVDDVILIDWNEDTLAHTLYGGLDILHLHTLLITHAHSGHLYEKDFGNRRKGFSLLSQQDTDDLVIYGSKKSLNSLSAYIQQLGPQRTAVCPVSEFEPFYAEGYRITPLPANHDYERCASVFYSIEKDGKALLYAHDTGCFNESVWQYLAQNGVFQLVSLDCTDMSDTRPRNGHMSLLTCSEVRRRMLDIGAADAQTRFVLNHFSHNATPLYEEALAMAQENGFELSFDGMEIIF